MSASNETSPETFSEAISLHQSKKFDEALAAYIKILDKGQSEGITQEQASTVSQNISVLYMQLGNTNLSYVYNKKALTLNPRNSAASQFSKNSLSTFKIAEIPREIPPIEQLNNLGLKFIPFELLAALTLFFIYGALKTIYRYLIDRKKAFTENTNPPSPGWMIYVFVLFLVLSAGLLGLKNQENLQATGIIKSPTVAVQTAAGANQAVITEVTFGHVVQILQTKDVEGIIYAQIKVPGAFSGWIKKADLEPLNSIN